MGSEIKLSEFVAKGDYTWFRLWDSTGSNSFKKNGTELDAKAGINIRASDLENTVLTADSSTSTQNLYIRGWDGSWSAWDKFALETKARTSENNDSNEEDQQTPLPIGQVANQSLEVGSEIKLSEFVAKGDYTWFRLWDSTGSNSFKKNGTELDAKAGINIRASDLANTVLTADSSTSSQPLYPGMGWCLELLE